MSEGIPKPRGYHARPMEQGATVDVQTPWKRWAQLGRTWTCQGCGGTKWEIWCWDCNIHWSGKTLAQLDEEKAVSDLDMVLSMTRDPEKVATS